MPMKSCIKPKQRRTELEPNNNQAARIHSDSDHGDSTVDVESPDMNGLTSALCHALAEELMQDERLQAELMEMLAGESGEGDGSTVP